MGVLTACLCAFCMCAQRSEESIESPEVRVMDGCELHVDARN